MGFVDDEDVELAGVTGGTGKMSRSIRRASPDLIQSMDEMSRGKDVHGLAWMPRSRRNSLMYSVLTTRNSSPNFSSISSAILPEGTQDKRPIPIGLGVVQELLNHETRFDGFSETNIVCNQKIRASHVDGADQGIELEVFDSDSASERCWKEPSVRVCCGPPANGIEKCFERFGVVLTTDQWQPGFFDDVRARFNLPDNVDLFTEAVFVDRRKGRLMSKPRQIPVATLALFGSLYAIFGIVVAYFFNFNQGYMAGADVPEATIGTMRSVALLPLVFRFLGGPLSDRINLLGFGHRKPYIVLGLGLQMLGLAGLAAVDPNAHLAYGAVAFVTVVGLALMTRQRTG